MKNYENDIRARISDEYPASKIRLIAVIIGLLITAIASYQFLYFSYKFLIPWGGMSDFAEYHRMVGNFMDFSAAKAPFVYRQVTTGIATILENIGVSYGTEIWFEKHSEQDGVAYSKSIFFNLMLANYIGLCVTGALVYGFVSSREGCNFSQFGFIAIAVLLLSWNTILFAVSPLTEGVSWAFITAAYISYKSCGALRYLAIPVILISPFQRETIPAIMLVAVVLDCIFLYWKPPNNKTIPIFTWIMAASCLIAMAGYYLMRVEVVQAAGHEYQTSIFHLAKNFVQQIIILLTDPAFIKQSILSLNTFALWIIMKLFMFKAAGRRFSAADFFFVVGSFTFLFAIGIAAGIGNNVGRIVGILVPILAIQIASDLLFLSRSRQATQT